MKRHILQSVLAGLVLCLWILDSPGQSPNKEDVPPLPRRSASKQQKEQAQIERLIGQLGSENFAEREAAGKSLENIGISVVPALRNARESADLEVRRRAVALLKSLVRKRSAARAKAWATLEKAGGTVGSEVGTPDGLISGVDLAPSPKNQKGATDDEAALLPFFDDARYLNLRESRISDDGLASIETFYRVQGLSLDYTKTITDDGLKHIENLVTLRTLTLYGTPVTDAGLPHLKKLAGLTVLALGDTRITDAGLEHIKGFKKLQILRIGWTQVTDKGIDHLKEIKTLTVLGLSRTHITDAGLAKLKILPKLAWLDLSKTQITDAGLVHLQEIRSLKFLNVNGTKVTKRGRAALQKSLPKLGIVDPR